MLKKLLSGLFVMFSVTAIAQTTAPTVINQGGYDSKTLVDTNSTSNSLSTVNTNNTTTSTSTATSTSTVTSTNTNNNVSTSTATATTTNTNNNVNSGDVTYRNVASGEVTYNNNNVNSGTVNYNNTNTSTATSTNTNTNTNVNTNDSTSTSTNTNNNNNTSTSTSTNTNNNVNTGDMTNRNINTSTSTATNNNNNTNTSTATNVNQNIQSGEMTNRNINETTVTQRVIQPPPTAIAPAMLSGGNPDLCTTGTSGAVQTQIFGVSSGGTIRDENCERLKLSKTLYDMGMKVAAVATMCQDKRVFDAMLAAGTPCPYEGKIGAEAKAMWEANPSKIPEPVKTKEDDTYKKIGIGTLLGIAIHNLFKF